MEKKSTLICDGCQVEMAELEVQFEYLDKFFRHKVLRCPLCGQVFLPQELVEGRMKTVEKSMEEK